jgi:hypothetical protein
MMSLGLPSFFSLRAGAAWLAGVLAVVGCGGGVDSGGTGSPTTSYASGAITGFGSVIVAGVRFDDGSATVVDAEGNARSRDDLKLGMTVEARGSAIVRDADGNEASTATSIVFRSELVGPLGASDLAARTMTVLGQTVEITATTVFDSALGSGQASLRVGDVVELYASVDAATGRYLATRVERRNGATSYALRGIVSGLDAQSRSFSIGPTRISYAGLGPAALPASLANGGLVRVSLSVRPGAGGVWTALAIGDRAAALDDREQAKLEGRVTAFTSATEFSIDGRPVDARAAAFPDGTTGLALGERVEAEGSIRAGVLVSTRVRPISRGEESGREFDVGGSIASLDAAGRTFVVRNVVVSYAGAVDFRDGSAQDLAVGREVEARGRLSSDGTRLQATRIDLSR